MVERRPPDEPPDMAYEVPGDDPRNAKAHKPNGRGRYLRYAWEPLSAEVPWLVKKRILRTGVGTLIGRGYTGKSHALVDLAWSIITERDWAACKVARTGGVVYFTAEGGVSIMRRFLSVQETSVRPWFEHIGRDMPGAFPFSICSDMPYQLLKQPEKAVDWYAARIREAQDVYRERCGVADLPLAIFDTMARYAGFRNENDNAECTAALQCLDAIGQATDCFVLAADHLPKDEDAKKPRGGSSKFDNADIILRIEPVGEGPARLLHIDKVRDGDSGQQVAFQLNVVERGIDEDGDAITTVHLTWSDQEAMLTRNLPGPPPKQQSELLQCLDEVFDSGMAEHINTPHFGRVFAADGDEIRQKFTRRVCIAGQSEKSMQDTYTRAVRQLKSLNIIGTYQLEDKRNFVFRIRRDEMRRDATSSISSPP